MTPDKIAQKVTEHFDDKAFEFDSKAIDPVLKIASEKIHHVCKYLKDEPGFFFDMCHSISGYDLGKDKELGVIYHLFSFKHKHWFTIKTEVGREESHIATVSNLWRTADWHEREIFDLYGIIFDDHPDLRRILCPDDWQGYPMRKDYLVQEYYHGIRVPYDEDWHKIDTLSANPDRGHFVFDFEKKLPIQNGHDKSTKEKE